VNRRTASKDKELKNSSKVRAGFCATSEMASTKIEQNTACEPQADIHSTGWHLGIEISSGLASLPAVQRDWEGGQAFSV